MFTRKKSVFALAGKCCAFARVDWPGEELSLPGQDGRPLLITITPLRVAKGAVWAIMTVILMLYRLVQHMYQTEFRLVHHLKENCQCDQAGLN